jgi:protoporphyrinogen oxidase
VRGLLEVEHALADDRAEVRNFRDWIYRTFGTGIAELFMLPYNRKVWAKPLEAMDYTWIAERVAVPSLEEVLHGVCTGTDHISWGPNRHFRFPRRGGTGAIWTALGRQLPQHQCRLNAVLEHINVPARIARLGDGTKIKYGKLISTLPLDELVEMDDGLKEMPGRELISSGTHVTGFGFEGAPPDRLRTKCWMYFPEQNSPYYRVTVFSNYSYFNVPQDKPRWSLMAETSVDSSRPVDKEALIDWTLRAMREDHLIPDTLQADTVFHHHLPKAYPTPYTGRNQAVDPLLQHLEARNIYSRGRFGAWKYETGNMDHCFMQGYECAERLVLSAGREREPTLFSSC